MTYAEKALEIITKLGYPSIVNFDLHREAIKSEMGLPDGITAIHLLAECGRLVQERKYK